MSSSAFVPTIYSTPACGSTVTGPNSGTHPGFFEWIIQAETDPRNTIGVDEPLRARLLLAPAAGILGETYEWTGAWIPFAAYGGSVEFAGDILYIPMVPNRTYTIEYYQLAESGAASEIVTCSITVDWDRTATASELEHIRYRAWDGELA